MAHASSPARCIETRGETARQAAELAAVRRMIEAAQGCFSLSIAVCNSPALRDYIIAQLKQSFPPIEVVYVPQATVDVFPLAVASANSSSHVAVMLTNLEASIPSENPNRPAVRSLNATREQWERTFACPVVIWVPEYAAAILSSEAPDLWRYRSHCFEFVSDQASAVEATADVLAGDRRAAAALSADEKRFRIAELEQRLADAGPSPSKAIAPHVGVWLDELAFLYRFVGDLDRAEEMIRKSLQVHERLGRKEEAAKGYRNLGLIRITRGDLESAQEMFQKALEINERLGRQSGIATDYGNLGLVYQARGDLNRAEEMFRKSLEIEERLGRREGIATDYGNLAMIYRARGDLNRAEEMLRKSLEINERLGRREGMAADYGNLGLIYRARGDLNRAEEMLRKALEIHERLGQREGMAIAYTNLGLIATDRGDVASASELLLRSRDLYRSLGLDERALAPERLAEQLPYAEEPQAPA